MLISSSNNAILHEKMTESSFRIACVEGNIHALKKHFEKDLGVKQYNDVYACWYAAKYGHLEILRELLKRGFGISEEVVYVAIESQQIAILKELLPLIILDNGQATLKAVNIATYFPTDKAYEVVKLVLDYFAPVHPDTVGTSDPLLKDLLVENGLKRQRAGLFVPDYLQRLMQEWL